MEKRKQTHDLRKVRKALGNVETLAVTTSALMSAAKLGYDRSGIVAVINSLTNAMFYKSMTTYENHSHWQDVYHVPVDGDLTLYVKIQNDAVTEFKVVSFKESRDG